MLSDHLDKRKGGKLEERQMLKKGEQETVKTLFSRWPFYNLVLIMLFSCICSFYLRK